MDGRGVNAYNGTNPSAIIIAPPSKRNIPFVPLTSIASVASRLSDEGIAFVEGIESESDLIHLATSFGAIYRHRDAEASGVTKITSKPTVAQMSGYKGFSEDGLFLHTDRSTVENPPSLLGMACHIQANTGGESIFADGKEILEALLRKAPRLATLLMAPQAAFYYDGANNYLGPVFEKSPSGRIMVRFRNDSCAYFSAALSSEWRTFMRVLARCSFSHKLEKTQGVLLDNYRWLHGRLPYKGERELWRVLVESDSQDHGQALLKGFVL